MPETATAVREISFGEAIREALAEEMRRDNTIVLMGEDVAEAGTTFKVLKGLCEEFGTDRIIDTPISEPGFAGIGVGAAMTGMRPVVDWKMTPNKGAAPNAGEQRLVAIRASLAARVGELGR